MTTEAGENVLETPWGKVKGIGAIVVVLLAVALGALGYLIFTRSTAEHEVIHSEVGRIGAILDEQNYIILSDEKERADIKKKMRMPQSLKEKMTN